MMPSGSTSLTQAVHDFVILSWNIDFLIPLGDERMTAALNHLQTHVQPDPPTVIFLQEMTKSDLKLIQAQSWVQSNFHVTDITDEHWESSWYGTCTLIPKTLSIASVFRVHYKHTAKAMDRDGLFVDIALERDNKPLRLCNTHLESLIADPPLRPHQLKCAATFMHASEVSASVLGGDLNAIEPFDKLIARQNNLSDAYLEKGGREDDIDGFTWGQMAKTVEREKFGLSRMDKLLFCGALHVQQFEQFGYDVQINDHLQHEREQMLQLGFDKPWVTDHLGIKGTFRISQVDDKATRL